jgi:membrane associated rhomboid family serine protease
MSESSQPEFSDDAPSSSASPSSLNAHTRHPNLLGVWLRLYPVTAGLIGLSVVAFLIEISTGGITGPIGAALYLDPASVATEPWRLLTSLFDYVGFIYVLIPIFSLYSAGPTLERAFGHSRFAAIFVISGFAGEVIGAVANIPSAGPGSAILGMLGALIIAYAKAGAGAVRILTLVGVNLVVNVAISLIFGAFAWTIPIGGLVAGLIVGLIFVSKRDAMHPHRQEVMAGILVVALVVVLAVKLLAY